jgi:hypothetical protein
VKAREAGMASDKRHYRLARSRAVPKGRPEVVTLARGSGEATRGQAHPSSRFCLAESGNWNGRKQVGQICLVKLMGISTQRAPTGSLKGGERGIGD